MNGQKGEATFIYAGCTKDARKDLWNRLINISQQVESPWLLRGDFNCITSTIEKSGGRAPNPAKMNTFSDNIYRDGLFDLGFKGPTFTWKRGAIWERLDRLLVNDAWFSHFLLTLFTHLSLAGSDHRPILISITSTDNYNSCPPFRYLNMWAAHPSYNKYIADLWKGVSHRDPFVKLSLLQIKIVRALRSWSWETFGNVHAKFQEAEDEVKNLEQGEYIGNDHNFRPHIEKAHFLAEQNYTVGLKLTGIPNEKEIWNAISSIDSNKSAGPDGFTAEFYKKSWEIIKADVIAVVTSLFQGNNIPKYFCSSTTVLIPKSDIQQNWNQFIPICLTTVISKTISKIIVNRLQPHLDSIIKPNQTMVVPSLITLFWPKNYYRI
ncbi:uncharacterized protein LOC110039059 [Phalaenopsis equestris]|uniref:uncharacterized protein LOC110039059 n=1 Tax=Phalaenopsis equestris TaxID=78828 RepID=UPI0009E50422|nr:uncharacterized protein LOC110039059 [Phalaenopsis equestris]